MEESARHHWTRALVACAVLVLAGCGGGGDSDNCTVDPAPAIRSTPPTVATVGVKYTYAADAISNCLLFFTCGAVDALRLPTGAQVFSEVVVWTPAAGDANTDAAFSIATKTDICGNRATQSWTVRVHPAPVIESFSAASTSIPRGERATLTAVFQGSGQIENLGPITSGVPFTTPPVNVSTLFTLVVSNNVGQQQRQSISIEVPTPPAIQSFSASPSPIAGGNASTLSWSTSGQFNVARIDPPGTDVMGLTRLEVRPAATTTYTLHLQDSQGATASASVQVDVVQMPAIQSFTALPASIELNGSVALTAQFEGTGRIVVLRDDGVAVSSLGAVSSGQSIASPPLQRYSGFRLEVQDVFGRTVSQDLFVNVTGAGTFQPAAGQPLLPARRRHAAVRLADGRVLIAGGLGTLTTEIFHPATETFTAGPQLAGERQFHSMVLLSDGRVLIVSGPTPTVPDEIYDPAGNSIAPAPWPGPPGSFGNAVRLADGRVVVGTSAVVRVIDAAATSRSEPITSGADGSCMAPLVRLGDDRVLGLVARPSPSTLFSPASGTFTPTGTAAFNRSCFFTATVAGNGRMLVAGGDLFPGVAAELYDPASGMYSQLGAQQTFTYQGTATMLASGSILLAGGSFGFGGSLVPQAELFDSASSAFTATGGLRQARRAHTATLLLDGRVLVVGGCEALPCLAEIYTP